MTYLFKKIFVNSQAVTTLESNFLLHKNMKDLLSRIQNFKQNLIKNFEVLLAVCLEMFPDVIRSF